MSAMSGHAVDVANGNPFSITDIDSTTPWIGQCGEKAPGVVTRDKGRTASGKVDKTVGFRDGKRVRGRLSGGFCLQRKERLPLFMSAVRKVLVP
jgi:hypothetical protein